MQVKFQEDDKGRLLEEAIALFFISGLLKSILIINICLNACLISILIASDFVYYCVWFPWINGELI